MRVPQRVVIARRERLAQLLRHHGYLPLAELCGRLRISEATARRDLAALARGNVVTRTYGGALVDFNQRFPSFRERQSQAGPTKRRIAAAAVRFVKPGMVCYFDAGTTVYCVAEALRHKPVERLTIITNNLPVAEVLSDVPTVEVHLLGGRYLARQSMLLGDHAQRALRQWKFDVAFLGAEGMTRDGLWDSQRDVVALRRTVIAMMPRCIFCMDSNKLGIEAAEFLLPWNQVKLLLTDCSLQQLGNAGIRLDRRRYLHAD
ncbi:MAG TPA: DeoR/GlpR family DNA-binding transcription regulator [Verrucomicrobiae bacterium]|nr:DeoR/GlpR family DNA-binding transcription regulator [Verrucomicrobiae bacterium]